MDYTNLTLLEASNLLKEGKVKSTTLVEQCFKQIEKTKHLNALNSVYKDLALEQAKKIDKEREQGKVLQALAGVPIVVKDNISVKGMKNTCSSRILSNYTAVYDATVIKKLQQAGAIVIAKANMDEFAMGSSNENSAFGPVLNPVNEEYVPGGSSGGSAASVKANQCYASLGTDTGGSVRQPASYCGLVGLKPTYGLVSRYGVVSFGSSFDQVGTFTKSVKDSAIMLNTLAGHDELESTSAKKQPQDYLKAIKDNIKGLKIGISPEYFNLGMDKEVKQNIEKAIDFFKENGAEVVDVHLPDIKASLAVYYVLSSAEVASNLGRFDGIRYGVRQVGKDLTNIYTNTRTEGFGKEVKRRIMLGNFVLSSGYNEAYYKKSEDVRTVLKEEFVKAFDSCDVILTPTSPTPAFKLGEKTKDHIKMYLNDVYTVAVNTIGIPAISVPCGENSEKMPIGLQLIANHFNEATLFNIANYFENNFNKEAK